jgi:hypothetical protein
VQIFIIIANIFLCVGTPHGCAGMFPQKEGGIQVSAGLAPASQKLGPILKTSSPDLSAEKFGYK